MKWGQKMIKKLSLRIRITMMTTLILISISVVLTVVSVYNADYNFVKASNTQSAVRGSDDMDSEEFKNMLLDNIISYYDSLKNSNNSINDRANAFRVYAILSMVVIIVIGSIFTYYILGKMLNPVKKLSKQIETINENKLSQRVVGFNTGDELNELADSFNIMLDRIDKAFESQKRFSSDAAHELKTPLTVLKTNLDVLAMGEESTDEDYKHVISVFRKQTERMISLVNNLFIMSNQKEYEFNDIVELDIMFSDIIRDLQPGILKKAIRVNISRCNLSIKANAIMLTHAISNLIENAVKYNNYNGDISIIINKDEKNCKIRIEDTGIGILKDKAEYIFEAFYRIDQSRSRKVGGAGLGLAITKDIINRHGGTIGYIPNEPTGSIFEVILPIK